MEDLMVGYDMVLSISQNEVSSQLGRLARAGYIQTQISSNGIVVGGILGGTTPKLTTYLRGSVDALQVGFGKRNNSQEVDFGFTFTAQDWTAGDARKWSLADIVAAFDATRGATATDALLVRAEDLKTRDPATGAEGTLAGQNIYYWLRKSVTTLGTTEVSKYSVIPAIYLTLAGQPVLVALEGLGLKFAVQLNKIPATAKDFEDGVAAGRIPPEVLKAITDHKFDQGIFSLEQMFLDFDTTDFTQWELRDPAQGLGAQVSLAVFGDGGKYTVRTVALSDLTSQDQQFSIELSANLQYVFGLQDKNAAGRTPYILGVAVSQKTPQVLLAEGFKLPPGMQAADPGPQASFAPTWIGYSSNQNPNDNGLSALNYEVLGGKDPNFERRIPRNNDKSIRHVATPLISSNNFSGTLLFSRDIFFEALINQPAQAALQTGAPWRQVNDSSFSSQFHESKSLEHERDVTDTVVFGKYGYDANVTQEDNHTYALRVQGNKVTLDLELHRHVEMEAKVYIADDLDFNWSRDFRGTTQATIEVYVDPDQQIRFKATLPPAIQIQMSEHKSSLADAADKFLGALEKIAMRQFNPAQQTLDNLARSTWDNFRKHTDLLKSLVLQSSHARFISPTGQVFLLNNPRFDGALDLQTDVTYSV